MDDVCPAICTEHKEQCDCNCVKNGFHPKNTSCYHGPNMHCHGMHYHGNRNGECLFKFPPHWEKFDGTLGGIVA